MSAGCSSISEFGSQTLSMRSATRLVAGISECATSPKRWLSVPSRTVTVLVSSRFLKVKESLLLLVAWLEKLSLMFGRSVLSGIMEISVLASHSRTSRRLSMSISMRWTAAVSSLIPSSCWSISPSMNASKTS